MSNPMSKYTGGGPFYRTDRTTSGNGTHTCQSATVRIRVRMVASGAGGSRSSSTSTGGNGGGAGEYADFEIPVAGGQQFTWVIGAAGAGAVSPGAGTDG